MAIQLSFTDQYGDEYPQAYFRVVQRNLNDENKTGMVLFYAYENAAKKGKRIIGQKEYNVTPEDYDAYFATDKQDPAGKNPKKSSYEFAKAKKDIGQGESAKSFFDGGVDV